MGHRTNSLSTYGDANSSLCAENSNTNVKENKKKKNLQAGLQSWEQLPEHCQEGQCRNKPWCGENQLLRPPEAPCFPVSAALPRLEAVFAPGCDHRGALLWKMFGEGAVKEINQSFTEG